MVVIAELTMLEVATAAGAPPNVEVAAGKPGEREAQSYRPDIDGLRAVAVLSVVIYHLNKLWMPGGYVGVDIFFVISGFLITRNIWGEMEGGRFSFANFYLRRIRRIAPAFLAMTAATVLAGALLLLPEDLLSLGKSAVWGVFSLSNVYFWRYLDTSYFAESADEVPLLHTWSLGVEEQFYFIWPSLLLLALLFRRRRAAALAIAAAICVASFVCGELTNTAAQKFSYYMLPARAGELMVGALLALGAKRIAAVSGSSRALAEVLAILGMALVAGSLYLLNDTSKFPGINALYPCLGAAMLMMAGSMGSRIVTVVLTPRPMVLIGLVSYSLYLWHWPVLAFIRYFYGVVDGLQALGAVLAISVLSILSYRYVELPARYWKGARLKQVLALYVMPSALLGAVALALVLTSGLRRLIEASPAYRDRVANLSGETAPASDFPYNCQLSTFDGGVLGRPECVLAGGQPRTSAATEPDILLWGDSQAAHYIGVVAAVLEPSGVAFRNATHSACPPLFAPKGYGIPAYRAGCDEFRPYMQSAILSGKYKTVVIGGAWDIYDANYPRFRSDLEQTVAAMSQKGLHVVLLGQAPYMGNYNRNCELRGARIGGVDCKQRYYIPDPGMSRTDRFLSELAGRYPSTDFLEIRQVICANGYCSPYVNGVLAYYNPTHLSMSGSWRIGRSLMAGAGARTWLAALSATDADMAGTAKIARAAREAPPLSVLAGFKAKPMPAILGGYTPSFPYHVRSQSNLGSRQGPAGVVTEFWGVRADQVLASVEKDLSALGFRRVWSGPSGAAMRMDFIKPGFPNVSVNVGPLGQLRPQAPNVAGIAYFRW
ncbi:acyltransferase family protein [Lysobacter solisilvae (ex Woo and Kim 2020)]|uniref:Acyltransferase n=1 Tax=Agrilutibacter terrestris TaxID=2865112 RepID=A0A7H0FZG3_9GAMM|nr:acyltransferase family protein [Lysobacter terrestris]QNP41429.1 acyltransferase [Lysobacter terrestris]